MKQGSFSFCTNEIHRTGMVQISLESSEEEGCRGASAWFHGIWTCRVEVLEYWMISSLKIKLNCSWKFPRNWNVFWVLLERSWWPGFNGIYLVGFELKMWEILILKLFLLLKIQINFKNQVSKRKISWGRGNTWANSTGHTTIHLQRKVVCLFCTYEIHRTRITSDHVIGLFGKLSRRRGALAVSTSSAKVFEYWMISSLKIKLN